MGDLAADTTVERTGPSTYMCELSSDWEIWGPNGGYLAAVAMRAAGIASGRVRPASINVRFVGAGRSEPVEIDIEVNRHTKVASSVTARITQHGRPLLVPTVWGADADLDGLEHHTMLGPHDVPGTDTSGAPRSCWTSTKPARRARHDTRSGRTSSSDRPSGSTTGRTGPRPSHRRAPGTNEPWLLSEASAPVATGGLVAGVGQIWTCDRQLVALGGSTLLCRPAGRRPDR